MKEFLSYLKPYKRDAVMAVFCIEAETVFELIIPLVMASIVDVGVVNGDRRYILMKGLQMVLFALISLVLGQGSAMFSARCGQGLGAEIRKAEFAKLQQFSFANIDSFSTGSLVTRLTNDIQQVQNVLTMGLKMALRAPGMFVGALFMAFMMNGKLAAILLVVIPLLSLAIGLILKTAFPRFEAMQKKLDRLNSGIQESLTNVRVVKSFVREEFEIGKFVGLNQDLKDSGMRALKIVIATMPVMMLAMNVTTLAVVWYGGNLIIGGSMPVGDLTAFTTYIVQILMSLMMLSMVFVMITLATESAQRIAEVLGETSSLTSPPQAVTEVRDGSVDFDGVSFKYAKTAKRMALSNIDLHIRSGETIGIIGGTGSSKSTLIQLISRLYDVTEGCVRVGGVDVRQYDLEALRNQVAVVLQKNVLFSGTISENLRWGNPDATDEQLKEACRLAQADEFISQFPKGYDTYIEQGGSNVSGGQKQRLCIARALLKRPKILILDDSTSAVDTRTDALIRKAMREYIPETTKIIIAQRTSSVEDADRIVVLDGGTINAIGTHQELLAANPIYQEVYTSQNKAGDQDEYN